MNYNEYDVGDIVTLSDIQTQKQYKETSVDFKIIEKRVYQEPNDLFTFISYLVEDPDELKLMLMIRQVEDEEDLRLYYLDQEEIAAEYVEAIITENGEDLEETFEANIILDDDSEKEVTWYKQRIIFGIETEIRSSDHTNDIKTIADYYTKDHEENPHCFVEWTGDEEGWIEVWYGCDIRIDDVEFFNVES